MARTEGNTTYLNADEWIWLMAWLDEPPQELPQLRALVERVRERAKERDHA